ncbi:50S ribosomal protein L19 [Puniceicoccaceae bacterium K14]|nr:50S ribosomal protein L19 [Puniceicoccaceae bacterium K14]
MNQDLISELTKDYIKADTPPFKVGDGVKVHTRVVEGGKERIQIFAGIVISRRGSGVNETFTVRRISYGEGVEKVFPVNSPLISKIEIEKESKVMRARMYYLRGLVGKKAMQVKEKRLAKGKH